MRGSDAPTPQATEIAAWWSNWWGSPQLLGHLASTLATEVSTLAGLPVALDISVASADQRERHASAQDFVLLASPEVVSRFTRIECRAQAEDIEGRIVLVRPRWPWNPGETHMTMRLTAPRQVPDERVHMAARNLIQEGSRGYQPFWGTARWRTDIAERSRYQRLGPGLRVVIDFALAAALGLGTTLAAMRMSGNTDPPHWALGVAVVSGGLIPLVSARILPAVEVAPRGKTRVVVLAQRAAVAAAGALSAQFLAFLAGK